MIPVRAMLPALALLCNQAAACQLQLLADLPVRNVAGQVVTTVLIDGTAVPMALQLEHGNSFISYDAIRSLHLAELRSYSIGTAAYVDSLLMGNLRLTQLRLVIGSITVKSNDPSIAPKILAAWNGAITSSVLARFDVEFDLAHDRVRLFSPNHCNGTLPYWTGPAVAVQFSPHFGFFHDGEDHSIYLPVELNGSPAEALLSDDDPNVVPADLASRFHIDSKSWKPVTIDAPLTVDQRRFPYYTAQLTHLTVGSESLANVPITISTEWQTSARQIILGRDFLAHNRTYIDYTNHMIYFTPSTLAR